MSTDLEVQIPLNGMQQYEKPATPTSLLQMAVERGAGIDTIERLAKLQMDMQRFEWEKEERKLRSDFDDALNECQKQIGRIAPNQQRKDSTEAWWADYAHLDKTIRPIYTAAGFSIAYSEVAPIVPGKIRIQGTLSRSGISKEYFREITPSTTGAKGNVMANATDADSIAASRAKRYLLLDMFNIAVGIDKEEKSGIPQGEGLDEQKFAALIEKIEGATSEKELKDAFFAAAKVAREAGDQNALRSFEKAKNDTWRSNGGFK